MASLISLTGLMAFVVIGGAVLGSDKPATSDRNLILPHRATPSESIRLLAVGDINLGRGVGQALLRGDTLFPFRLIAAHLRGYDLVIGNLECQLTDQGGLTQHPENNLIFSGPPVGAYSLREAGLHLVSTANNHAYDYGSKGLEETIAALRDADVHYAGTGTSDDQHFQPARLEINGISVAFFACTDVMNIENPIWRESVASADSSRIFPMVREIRAEVDFVILSYHGGNEYAGTPSPETTRFAAAALKAGVDLFLGHHPHVPQGIEQAEDGMIVYSLGNFVFRQPFSYWTQRSFMLDVLVRKRGKRAVVEEWRCIPIMAGDQPFVMPEGPDSDEILRYVMDRSAIGSGVDS